jgi:hypothetical protein
MKAMNNISLETWNDLCGLVLAQTEMSGKADPASVLETLKNTFGLVALWQLHNHPTPEQRQIWTGLCQFLTGETE